MKLSIILMAAAVQQALTAAIALAEPRKLVERSNWYDTCYSASLLPGTTIVQAYCYNAAGNPHYTQLELNNCFNNNNGQIYFGGSGFGFSCSDCQMQPQFQWWLTCGACRNNAGSYVYSEIDTLPYLSNQNGNLACD